jgi:hypothetical protein
VLKDGLVSSPGRSGNDAKRGALVCNACLETIEDDVVRRWGFEDRTDAGSEDAPVESLRHGLTDLGIDVGRGPELVRADCTPRGTTSVNTMTKTAVATSSTVSGTAAAVASMGMGDGAWQCWKCTLINTNPQGLACEVCQASRNITGGGSVGDDYGKIDESGAFL